MRSAPDPVRRRSFLSRLAVAASAVGLASPALGTAAQSEPFRPARHAEDDWLDTLPGKHRFVLDAISTAGADDVRQFASNFFAANRSGYGLAPSDLAVVIILRHWATAFAFNDAMWAKYGDTLGKIASVTDPATHEAPRTNIYWHSGIALPGLIAQGVHFAVCGVALRFFAGEIAGRGDAGAIADELRASLIPNSHLMAAGVVAVNRAQERGFTYGYVG